MHKDKSDKLKEYKPTRVNITTLESDDYTGLVPEVNDGHIVVKSGKVFTDLSTLGKQR